MATRKPKATVSPPKNVNIIWRPQPKQALMMSRPEYEALYGGAAGGGKSDYLLVEALRQVNTKNYRGIIFRKTYPELQDLIDRSDELYRAAYPSARYNDTKHRWSFPSGAKIAFGAMQYTRDRKKYQGKHFDFIGFDELTHFTYDEYKDDVVVALNGKVYVIKRGVRVKVPRAVKEILDHSREQDQQTALMTEEMESDFQQKAEKYK